MKAVKDLTRVHARIEQVFSSPTIAMMFVHNPVGHNLRMFTLLFTNNIKADWFAVQKCHCSCASAMEEFEIA